MAQVHKLNPIVDNTGNYPLYRFEGSCQCGFATKQATEQAVVDQLNSHLQYHGVPNIRTLADEQTEKGQQAKKDWVPMGARKQSE